MAKGIQLPNVYENLAEAHLRLRGTVVMYEGEPFNILAITNHKDDGIFRTYVQPLTWDGKSDRPYPPVLNQFPATHSGLGEGLDAWLETPAGKKSGIERKRIDSRHFNSFRPFPLGMVNTDDSVVFVEWSPLRATHQGLTEAAMQQSPISLNYNRMKNRPNRGAVSIFEPAFGECIRGDYPPAREVLAHLKNPLSRNEAYAFNRKFAIVKGPCEMLFLAYKTDIIGYLPNLDFSLLRLSREFGYCREVAAELRVFNQIG